MAAGGMGAWRMPLLVVAACLCMARVEKSAQHADSLTALI
jgi:hypothetical protein